MLTPTQALARILVESQGCVELLGPCVDYHKCWVFPKKPDEGDFLGGYIYVDKKTGALYPIDPSFDIVEFSEAKDYSFDIPPVNSLEVGKKAITLYRQLCD